MTGHRKKDRHLPARVYQKHGAFYFVDMAGKWHRLAKDYPAALEALAKHMATGMPTATVAALLTLVAGVVKDAERYRFIRSGEYSLPDEGTWRTEKGALLLGDDLDMAVDRTMSGETE